MSRGRQRTLTKRINVPVDEELRERVRAEGVRTNTPDAVLVRQYIERCLPPVEDEVVPDEVDEQLGLVRWGETWKLTDDGVSKAMRHARRMLLDVPEEPGARYRYLLEIQLERREN